jgi:hypothetical protein
MVLAIVLLLRVAILGSGVAVGLYQWRHEPGSARNWWLGFSILCTVLLLLAVVQPFVWPVFVPG